MDADEDGVLGGVDHGKGKDEVVGIKNDHVRLMLISSFTIFENIGACSDGDYDSRQ